MTAGPPCTQLPAFQKTGRRTVDNGFQAHVTEILHRFPYHAFKAEEITDIHGFFLMDILPGYLKSNAVTFGIGIRHPCDFFLGKCIQITGHTKLVFRDI